MSYGAINISAVVEYQNGLWLLDRRNSILFYFDFNEMMLTKGVAIPCGKYSSDLYFSGMCRSQDDLFIVPYKGAELWIFNVVSEEFKRIKIPEITTCYIKFVDVFCDKNNIICVPFDYSKFLILNTVDMSLRWDADWKQFSQKSEFCAIDKACFDAERGIICCASYYEDSILLFSTEDFKCTRIDCKSGIPGFSRIYCDCGILYAACKTGESVVCIDLDEKKLINTVKYDLDSIDINYISAGRILLSSDSSGKLIICDRKLSGEKSTSRSDFLGEKWTGSNRLWTVCLDDERTAITDGRNMKIVSDKGDQTELCDVLYYSLKEWNESSMNNLISSLSFLAEGEPLGLDEYLILCSRNFMKDG